MPIYFNATDLPPLGSIVVFSRRDEESGETRDLQRFTLKATQPHTDKDGQASAILTWVSACMEEGCGASFSFTSGLATDAFYRRCKKCRRGKRFTGWPKGPRIKHRLIVEDGGAIAPPAPLQPESDYPLHDALSSSERITWLRLMKAETGTAPTRDQLEQRLREESEIDPASLF